MLVRRIPLYLLREAIPLYVVGVATILILLVLDYFASLAGYFLRHQTPILIIAQNLLDRIPFFLSYMLAPALAFAIPVGLGRIGKDSELKVLFALGIRPLPPIWTFVLFGFLIFILSFVNTNLWQPVADARWKESFSKMFNTQPTVTQELRSYATGDGGTVFHAGTVAPKKEDLKNADLFGVTVINPSGTYTATRGLWDSRQKTWELFTVYHTDPSGKLETVPEPRRVFNFQAALEPDAKPPQQLPLGELWKRANTTGLSQDESYTANYQLQRRFADPSAAIMMALLGAAVGLTISSRATGFLMTIVVLAGYWALWTMGQQLAVSFAVPFWFAAWLPTIVFAVIAGFALRRLT
jgi:lipopolysaccharide export system permease protein